MWTVLLSLKPFCTQVQQTTQLNVIMTGLCGARWIFLCIVFHAYCSLKNKTSVSVTYCLAKMFYATQAKLEKKYSKHEKSSDHRTSFCKCKEREKSLGRHGVDHEQILKEVDEGKAMLKNLLAAVCNFTVWNKRTAISKGQNSNRGST